MSRLASPLPREATFGWHFTQPAFVAIGFVVGLGSGWAFGHTLLPFAWLFFIFSFVWILVLGLGLAMYLVFRHRIGRGDWRASMHIGFASTFPLTTTFLAGMILLTFAIPLETIDIGEGKFALSRPDFLSVIPVFYVATLVLAIFCGPFYASTAHIPSQRLRE